MKKHVSIIMVLCCIITITVGCTKNLELKVPDEAEKYEFRSNSDLGCMEIEHNGKIYRPFSVANINDADEIIGYYEDGPDIGYVFKVKNQSTEEWLINAIDNNSKYLNGSNIGTLYKEVNITDIPEGFSAEEEYEWNK